MSCSLACGKDAQELIASEEFQGQWASLHNRCPWSTVFQGIPFATTWYRIYEQVFVPVVVWERNGHEISGLFLLGYSERTGRLVPVGGRDAEYDSWLATAIRGDGFIEDSLDVLSTRFPNATLSFQYLAAESPTAWARTGRWAPRCELVPVSRALREIGDGSSFTESLKKKSNKSRYSRLQKMGQLEFVRLTRPEDLAQILDEIALQSDFRHGAIHNFLPFQIDPLRTRLYAELGRFPGLLHATVLRLSGELLAAHVGFCNRDQVLLGIITHSPLYSQHSPGKILLLLLGLELAREGVPEFDLTPGTLTGYKERFASHHDEVHVLTVRFNRRDARQHRWERKGANTVRSLLRTLRLDPGKVRRGVYNAIEKLRHGLETVRTPARFLRYWWFEKEVRIYSRNVTPGVAELEGNLMNKDDLTALLAFSPLPGTGFHSRQEFLSVALARLENGGHVYTRCEGGRLVHFSWMERPSVLDLKEVGQQFPPPQGSVVIRDCFTHPDFRRRGFCTAAISQILREVSTLPDVDRIYLPVSDCDIPLRTIAERAGFLRERSFWIRKRLWNEVKKETASEDQAPRGQLRPS